MNQSIIEASAKAKRRGVAGIFRRRNIIILAAVLAIVFGAWYYNSRTKSQAAITVQPKEWTVKRGDIKTAVDTSGKVVAREGVELSFAVSGDSLEVESVYVKEGQQVKKGDKVASVKTASLSLNLRNAYASYQSSLAKYNETIVGATDDQVAKAKAAIEQAKISLEQSKLSLEKTRTGAASQVETAEKAVRTAREALDKNPDIASSEDVRDAYESMVDTIKSVSISLDSILPASDKIIGVDDQSINDSFESNLGVKSAGSLNTAQGSYVEARTAKTDLERLVIKLSAASPYLEIDDACVSAQATVRVFERHLYDMSAMLSASITSNLLSQTALDGYRSTINGNRTSINTKITSLENARKAVTDAKDGLDDYIDDHNDANKFLAETKADGAQDIVSAESSVKSRELSLRDAEQDLVELQAPLTDSERAAARSSLVSASVSLERAQNDMKDAELISPIDGVVGMLNYAAGDIIVDPAAADPVAVIVNNETLFIEVNIEEADINKIKVGDRAFATFDAIDGLELEGEIGFIALTSETSNNGIVTYLVRVIFTNPKDSAIREGMTASVSFVTAGVKDVLTAPVDAVRNVGGKPSVRLASGEWTPVTTGFTDGKSVEVISGVKEGDRLVY